MYESTIAGLSALLTTVDTSNLPSLATGAIFGGGIGVLAFSKMYADFRHNRLRATETSVNQGLLDAVQHSIDQLQKSNQSMFENLESFAHENAKLMEERKVLHDNIEAYRLCKEEMRKEVDKLRGENEVFRRRVSELNTENTQLRESIEQLQIKTAAMESKNLELETAISSFLAQRASNHD